MSLITEESIYEGLRQKGHLNEKGLNHLIKLLNKEIIDYSPRIKQVTKTKGYHGKGTLKEANLRAKASALRKKTYHPERQGR